MLPQARRTHRSRQNAPYQKRKGHPGRGEGRRIRKPVRKCSLNFLSLEVSSANERPLVTRLGSYDTAVAIQTASLLRAEDPVNFERRVGSRIHAAPPHVAEAFLAYLDAWNESHAGPRDR